MIQYDKCPSCFFPIESGTVCSNCKNDYLKDRRYANVLPVFTVLNNRYLIGKVLGRGGFGITYAALDTKKNIRVAIKEYMPSEHSSRAEGTLDILPNPDRKSQDIYNHGKEKFVDEARTLLKLQKNPTVVDITDFFKQNATAYLVMEYIDGQDLRKLSKSTNGIVDTELMNYVFVTIANALISVHKANILHRDISPENIMITIDGKVKLTDFGAARNYVSSQNIGMSILLKHGFAPPEQYNRMGEHGPWTDIYSLCATYYTLVSGKPLVDALFRYRGQEQPTLAELNCKVTKKTSDVIAKGMELEPKKRYADFKELLDDIDFGKSIPSVNSHRTVKTGNKDNAEKTNDKLVKTPYIACIYRSKETEEMYLSTKDYLKIGRSPQSCQYPITGDTNISRIHCFLRFDGKNVYLTDNSANGTYFENGKKLTKGKEYVVKPGTKFYLATKKHMLIVNE